MLCPQGEFLQGFDANGALVCAAADGGDPPPPPPPLVGVPPSPGDILVVEVMVDPNNSVGGELEWFELYNVSNQNIELQGVVVTDDGTDSFEIVASLVVVPQGYAVIGGNNFYSDFVWSNFILGNLGDEIELFVDGVSDERFVYDAGFSGQSFQPDKSMSIFEGITDPGARQNVAEWCPSSSVLPVGTGFGTPGSVNDACF